MSFIIPTIGRPCLADAIDSVELWPGDQLLVVQLDPPGGGWGHAERNHGLTQATCDYIAFLDDDDCYVPGHRDIMEQAASENINAYPMLFRMEYPSGRVLWDQPVFKSGNFGTPCIFLPNIRHRWSSRKPITRTHPWEPIRETDFQFANSWGWPDRNIIWRPEVIALLGKEDETWARRNGSA